MSLKPNLNSFDYAFLYISVPPHSICSLYSCSNLFNNDSDGPELNFQATQSPNQTTTFNGDTLVFMPVENGEGPIREYDFPEFTSEVQDNRIIIHGYYLASSDFKIASSFDYDDQNNITINIHMDRDDNEAPNIPKGYLYDAYVTNVSEGNYNVEIIHDNDLMRGKYGESHTIFVKEFEVK